MSSVSSRLIVLYGLIVACLVSFWPSTLAIVELWNDFANLSYAHGYLVGAVALFLVFWSRRQIAAAPLSTSKWALAGLAVVTFAWLVFWRASIRDLQLVLIPLILWLVVCASMGWALARRVWFPFAYLYFALPGWEVLTPALQWLTVYATRIALVISRLPAAFEGNLIYIKSGVIEIAGGCSGLHFFVVGVALAALLGELLRERWAARIKLVALMVGMAMVLNWVRVYALVIIGHVTQMQSSLMHHHYNFGWALFAVMLVIYLRVSRKISPHALDDDADSPVSPDGTPNVTSAATAHSRGPLVAMWAAVIGMIVLAPVARLALQARAPSEQDQITLLRLPAGVGEWRGPSPAANSEWQPHFSGASFRAHARYDGASGPVIEMLVVEYRSQRQDAELIGSGNSLSGVGKETLESAQVVNAAGARFNETVTRDEIKRRYLTWSVYEVAGKRIVRPMFAQLWYGLTSITSEQSAGVVAFRTECANSCEQARNTLSRFVSELGLPGSFPAAAELPRTVVSITNSEGLPHFERDHAVSGNRHVGQLTYSGRQAPKASASLQLFPG